VELVAEEEFRMSFEVFNRRSAPLAKAPSLTIQKRGTFSMNKAAHRMINEPESVELLFDRDSQIVAIRPSNEAHAYTLRTQGKSDTGQVVLSGAAFTKYYDIDTSVSRRFKPYEQEGMLCVDLRGESSEVVGNRAKRDSEDSAAEEGESES
jgi:hypothetical protein